MPDLILLFFILVILQSCIRLGFVKWPYLLGYTILMGLINFLVYPFIVSKGNTFVADLFKDKKLTDNLVLIITLESILFLTAGFIQIRRYLLPSEKETTIKKWIAGGLTFPGCTLLLASFYFQHQFLLWISHIDYDSAACLFAVATTLTLFIFTTSLRYLLRHFLLRMESAFILITAQVFFLLILLNLQQPSTNTTETPVNILPLISFTCIACCLALSGYFINQTKNNK